MLGPLAGTAMPGQGSAPGSIIGQVVDKTGAVLPGVTVSAAGPALQVPSLSAVTDAKGEYRLTPLPVGVYAVTYELAGFQALTVRGVQLTVGFIAKLDQSLSLGTLQETVSVTASPLVDVTSTATRTELTPEAVELLPTNKAGLKSFFTQVPGIRSNVEVGNSGSGDSVVFRVYGQSSQAYSTLEGVWAGGNGAVQPGNHFEFNALDGVRVQTVGSNAEMPKRGLLLDATTKSGGNDFHGGASESFANHSFESSNISDEYKSFGLHNKPELHWVSDVNANLGGRIIRNKLWFFASYRKDGNDQDALDAFDANGGPVLLSSRQSFHVEKLSYQISPNNKLIGFNHWFQEFQRRDASKFVPAESRLDSRLDYNIRKVEWQSVRGNALLLSVQYGYFDYIGLREGLAPGRPPTLDIATQFVTGNHPMDNQIPNVSRQHPKATVSWYKANVLGGNHEVRAGFDTTFYTNKNQFLADRSGDYQLRFNNGVPFQVLTKNNPANPIDYDRYVGLYVQDSWTVGRRLTLNLGVRYDRDHAYVPEQCRGAGNFAIAECYPEASLVIWNSVTPRLNAAFDLFGDGKTAIKGGFGRFNQLREGEAAGLNGNVSRTTAWRWTDRNGNRDYDPGEANLNPNGPDFVSITTGSTRVANPDERQPKNDQFSLTFEREVLPKWTARVTGVYFRSYDTQRLLTVARPPSAFNIPIVRLDPGPDGVSGNGDDPGTSITYYDFPTQLAGAQFEAATLTNDPNATQTYKTIEVSASRRLSEHWQFSTSYSATRKHIPLGTGQPALAYNPNAEIFVADNTWEWNGKVSGAYLFPRDIIGSVNYEHRSGDAAARQVLVTGGVTVPSIVLNVEPIGSRRLPNLNLLDLRADKRFSAGAGRSIEIRLDVFNALNIATPRTLVLRSGPNFLRPVSEGNNNATAIVPPRLFMLGVLYRF